MVQTNEISVVIQGAFSSTTEKLIRKFMELLPGCEIIVSTWRGQKIENSIKDIHIIYNDDPGAISATTEGKRYFNLNRQIVSSLAGVRKSSRKYVLKCRSDLTLLNTNFLNHWDDYPKFEEEYKLNQHKILLPSLYTIFGELAGKVFFSTPFHVSDWYCFGLKKDIIHFLDVPTVQEPDFSQYILKNNSVINYPIPWLNERTWKFSPEQYFGYCYFRKKFPETKIENCIEASKFDMQKSASFVVSNFIVLEPIKFGLVLDKGPYFAYSRDSRNMPDHIINSIFSEKAYSSLYNMDFEQLKKLEKLQIETNNRNFKVYRHAILTPTYKPHFCFIEKYLESFDKFVEDKDEIVIYFVISKLELKDFCSVINKYFKKINIRLIYFESLLNNYGIKEDDKQLMRNYGRFSFQTLKKFLAIKEIKEEQVLILDSESVWCNPTKMSNLFDEYFRKPTIFFSSLNNNSVFKNKINSNINYILDENNNDWFIETFAWFYDKKIVDDMFHDIGGIYDNVIKTRNFERLKFGEKIGVFEIELYYSYIKKNNKKYNYNFINIEDLLSNRLSPYNFTQLREISSSLYNGETGFAEHIGLLLTKRNLLEISKVYKDIPIVRMETFSIKQFIKQFIFIKASSIKILAASQDHWFIDNRFLFGSVFYKKVANKIINSVFTYRKISTSPISEKTKKFKRNILLIKRKYSNNHDKSN